MIQLEHISKTFGSKAKAVHAVKDVTLNINDHEIYGIIGFSGAGKSTLVRCINLLERPDSGKVILDGQDLMTLSTKQLREVRTKIGMIFQHFNLLTSRTVYQNIAYPLKKSSLSKQEKEAKINSLLELVDLSDKANAYPAQLSGGQKQRVAIARALANDPSVLLCDEATSALDPQTTQSILKLLKEVNEKLGITIILITHEMAVVKDICDHVAIMEHGHLVEEGSTIDIFTNPKQEITKQFIDTASNINKLYELAEAKDPIVAIEPNEKLVLLTYVGNSAQEPLIWMLSEKYRIRASIVFGNIDYLKGQPLGKLAVILNGDPKAIEQALQDIQEQNVHVEVIQE